MAKEYKVPCSETKILSAFTAQDICEEMKEVMEKLTKGLSLT